MTNKNKNIFFLARSSRQRGTRCPSSPRRSPTATPCRRGCGSFGKTYFCFFLIVFFLFLLTAPVSAQAAGLIPCGGPTERMCKVCDFFVLIKNIINLILLIFASLATLMAVYIGFLFMFSGGSPAKITDAKGKLWLLLWGIFWVLGSWLVLNTILNLVANPTAFPWPWNKPNC